jgi:hypothetical protein
MVRSKGLVRLVLGLAVIAWGAAAARAEQPAGNPRTQAVMHTVFAGLTDLLPFAFDRAALTSPKNRPEIERKLRTLADGAAALKKHGETQSRGFAYVASSLATDAQRAGVWFDKGRYEEAEFTLRNMTANCVECHSSLPESHAVPAAAAFFEAVKVESLAPAERAEYLVASRQFDAALGAYEEIIADTKINPVNLVVMSAVSDYLKVAIRVKSDFARPRAALAGLLARPTTLPHVRAQVERWTAALKEFEGGKVLASDDLAVARRILSDGRKIMEFPRDRDGLVHFVTANAILSRYVHTRPDRGVDVAEAYYLLGVSESLISHSFWIARGDFDFESAIRLAPGAPFARKAYAELEESYIAGYSGSSGTNVPAEVQALLLELRRLIVDAQGIRI